LYARNRVYEGVTGMESFGPWLERLEKRITDRVLDNASRDILRNGMKTTTTSCCWTPSDATGNLFQTGCET
jgi:hypothetical protein